jgi:hypothetical protein
MSGMLNEHSVAEGVIYINMVERTLRRVDEILKHENIAGEHCFEMFYYTHTHAVRVTDKTQT